MIAIEAVHASGEAEELGAGQTAEQRHAFGHDTDLAFHFDRMSVEIEAEDFDASGTGRKQSGEHLDGGGLSCAVRAEETEELSGRDAQVDVVDGNEFSEAAGQALGRDGGCEIHQSSESSTPTGLHGAAYCLSLSRELLFLGLFFLHIFSPGWRDAGKAGVGDRLSEMLGGVADDEEQNAALGVLAAEPVQALVEVGVGHGFDGGLGVGEGIFQVWR